MKVEKGNRKRGKVKRKITKRDKKRD